MWGGERMRGRSLARGGETHSSPGKCCPLPQRHRWAGGPVAGPGSGTWSAGISGFSGQGWAPIAPPGHSASSPIPAGPGSLGTGGRERGDGRVSKPEQEGGGALPGDQGSPGPAELPCSHGVGTSRSHSEDCLRGRWGLVLHSPVSQANWEMRSSRAVEHVGSRRGL